MSKQSIPSASPKGTWVQTERRSHEEWARLTVRNPKAGALLHLLAARVSEHNAVVVSQAALAKLMGVHINTIKRALEVLRAENWLEIRQIGASGSVNAYVLNDRAVWSQPRAGLRFSLFSANVVAIDDEQPDREELGQQEPLKRLPRTGEAQLPAGPGLPPPSQPFFNGLEPDLPATGAPEEQSEATLMISDPLAGLKGTPRRR
jgi:hypothetical protein